MPEAFELSVLKKKFSEEIGRQVKTLGEFDTLEEFGASKEIVFL